MDWLAPTVFLWKFVFPPTSPSVSLSLFATRHDEPRTRQRIVRNDIVPPCSANNVAPIPTYASLVFLPPIFPSSTSFFFPRLFLSNYANARSYGETRILKTRTSFSEMNFLSRRMQTRLWLFFLRTKKIVANCMLYRLFSLLDLKDFGYFFLYSI